MDQGIEEMFLKTLHHFFMPAALQSSVWPCFSPSWSSSFLAGSWGQKLPRDGETKFLPGKSEHRTPEKQPRCSKAHRSPGT